MIDAKTKEAWVKALRSGRYGQARKALRGDGCFCVLGVLLDVVDPDGWSPGPVCDGRWGHNMEGDLTEVSPDLLPFMTQHELMGLNDGAHLVEPLTFAELADWIDLNVEVAPPLDAATASLLRATEQAQQLARRHTETIAEVEEAFAARAAEVAQ